MASDGPAKSFRIKIDSIGSRMEAYRTSPIVVENIQAIEEEYQVRCQEGEVTTGVMDNPLINRNIYTAKCSGDSEITVRIISKMVDLNLKKDSENKSLVEFRLRKITIK